jgi:hypothetical protein
VNIWLVSPVFTTKIFWYILGVYTSVGYFPHSEKGDKAYILLCIYILCWTVPNKRTCKYTRSHFFNIRKNRPSLRLGVLYFHSRKKITRIYSTLHIYFVTESDKKDFFLFLYEEVSYKKLRTLTAENICVLGCDQVSEKSS